MRDLLGGMFLCGIGVSSPAWRARHAPTIALRSCFTGTGIAANNRVKPRPIYNVLRESRMSTLTREKQPPVGEPPIELPPKKDPTPDEWPRKEPPNPQPPSEEPPDPPADLPPVGEPPVEKPRL